MRLFVLVISVIDLDVTCNLKQSIKTTRCDNFDSELIQTDRIMPTIH